MPDIELLLRDARPHWPSPPDELEARILASLAPTAPPTSPRRWLRRAPRSRRLRLLAVGVLLAGCGAALAVAIADRLGTATGGAHASLAMGAPETVAHIGGFLQSPPAIAVDDSGTASLAWARAGRVVVASRPRSGAWSAEQPLSARGVRANQPQAAAGPGGAVVIWRERILGGAVSEDFTLPGGRSAGTLTARVDTRWRVAASARDRAGRWSAPVGISPDFGGIRDAYAPALVETGSGDALAGYTAAGRAWAVRRAGAGTWGRPSAISSGSGTPSAMTLAAAPTTGWVIATWIVRSDDPALGRRWQLWTARATPGEVWEAPVALTVPTESKPFGRAAINDRGEAVVAWVSSGTNAVTRGRTGAWSSPARLSPSPLTDELPDAASVGVDAQGGSLVSILGAGGARIVRRESGGDWLTPELLRSDGRVTAIVPDAAGGLLIATTSGDGRSSQLLRLDREGAKRGAATLPALGYFSAWAVGGDGTTAVAGARDVEGETDLVAAVAAGRGHR